MPIRRSEPSGVLPTDRYIPKPGSKDIRRCQPSRNRKPACDVRLLLSILRKLSDLSWILLRRSKSLKPVVRGPRKSSGYCCAQLSDSAWEADVLPLNYTRLAAQLVNNERLFRRHNDLPGADKAARNHERITFSDGDRMS